MSKRDLIHKELAALYNEGAKLYMAFQKKKAMHFQYDYQLWYTKALKVAASLAPDRHAEFRGYYEIDPRRKSLGFGTFVIQDFFKGVVPGGFQHAHFDSHRQVLRCFYSQLTILKAVEERVDTVLADIEGELYADLQDSELGTARQLAKINLRAAGALVGVVIEGHLQKVASAHSIKLVRKNPSIADLNDALKSASIIDTPTWRKISYLADLRNLCSHKKDSNPKTEEIEELIHGAEWLPKKVF